MEQSRRFIEFLGMAGSMHPRVRRTRFAARLMLATLLLGLPGCETLVAIATHDLMTGAGIASYAFTGKGLADHALTVAMGRDCRIVQGMVSRDRGICEDFLPDNMPAIAFGTGSALPTIPVARASPPGLHSLILSDTLSVSWDLPSGPAGSGPVYPSAVVELSLSWRISRDRMRHGGSEIQS